MESRFSSCVTKSGYVHIKTHVSTHPMDKEHNTAFSVVDRLSENKEQGELPCLD